MGNFSTAQDRVGFVEACQLGQRLTKAEHRAQALRIAFEDRLPEAHGIFPSMLPRRLRRSARFLKNARMQALADAFRGSSARTVPATIARRENRQTIVKFIAGIWQLD
jgi:hypothetical protein